MKYTVNDLKKYLGISPETVRHYRNLGLITPEQDLGNNYYYYSDWDAFQLFFIRRYRSLDLSISDVKSIQGGITDEEQLNLLKDRERTLSEQIEMLSVDLEHTKQIHHFMEMTIRNQGLVEVVNWEDDFYAIYLLGKGIKKPDSALIQSWIQYMPFTYLTLSIPADQLNDYTRNKPYDVQIGLACVDSVRKLKNIPVSRDVEIIKGSLSVRTFISVENPFVITPHDIQKMLSYVREHNYRFINHSSGWIMVNDYSGRSIRCEVLLRVAIG